jgi:hypothetical protein
MTGSAWNMTFTEAIKLVRIGDFSHSRRSNGYRDKFAIEWLHAIVANQNQQQFGISIP